MIQTLNVINTYRVAALIFFLTIIAVGTFIYWLIVPSDPLKFYDGDGKETDIIQIGNKNKQVKNGEVLILKFNYCKTVNTIGKGNIRMIGDSIVNLVEFAERSPKSDNCPQKLTSYIELPRSVNFEKRHIEYTVIYSVNPTKTIVEEFKSEEFTIVP